MIENAAGDTWRNIRHELDRMHLVTLATNAGQIAQRTTSTAGQQTLLRAIDLPEPPKILDYTLPVAPEPPSASSNPCSNTTPTGLLGVPAGQRPNSAPHVLMIFGSPARARQGCGGGRFWGRHPSPRERSIPALQMTTSYRPGTTLPLIVRAGSGRYQQTMSTDP